MGGQRSAAHGWWRRLVPAVALLGLLGGAGWQAAKVAGAEHAADTVVVVADQPAFAALEPGGPHAVEGLFARLGAAGVGALGVPEATLATLEGSGLLTLVDGGTWVNRVRAGLEARPAFPLRTTDTYVVIRSAAAARWLAGALPAAVGPHVAVHWYRMPHGVRVAAVPLASGLLAGVPLGFQPGSFALARRLHLALVPRPASGAGALVDGASFPALYNRVRAAGIPVAAVVFSGTTLAPGPGGGTAGSARAAALLSRAGWPLGVIRLPLGGDLLPAGMGSLVAGMPGGLVRVYGVPALASFTPQETANLAKDVARADARVVYIRPVVGSADPVGTSIAYVRSLVQALRGRGLRVGERPSPLPAVRASRGQRLIEAAGVAAAALWALLLAAPAISDAAAAAVGIAAFAVLALAALAGGAGGSEALATASATAASGLAAAAVLTPWRRASPGAGVRAVRSAVAGVLGASAALLAGGLSSGMPWADGSHLLGWAVSTSGHAVDLLALAAVAAVFAAAVGPGRTGWAGVWRRVVEWADRPIMITVKGAVAFLIVAAVVVYLRHRAIDIWVYDVRAPWQVVMGRWLTDPPSERVVLVGYPALFLAGRFALRGMRWALLVALLVAAVGQIPLIAGLEHVSVPLIEALRGAFASVLLGSVAGCAALGAAWLLAWAAARRRAPEAEAETEPGRTAHAV